MVDRDQPELVLLDIKMAGMDGLEVLQRLKAGHEALPVVMISGHATVSTAVEATKLGAFDFIEKPLSTERVLVTVRNALDRHRLVDENITLRKAQEVRHQLVGESAALRGALDAVKRAAPTTATVLITGESGVGKELVARAIHRNSLRARERFVQVNCAAIPDDLIESELFGHEKGSFTGATEKQVGQVRAGRQGHHLPGRSGRHEPEDAGQGAARPAGRRGRAARVGADDEGGRARHRGDQQEPRGGSRARQLPRRPLLPAQRDSDSRAAAPRASRGRPRAGAALPGPLGAREQPAAEEGQRGRDRGVAAVPVARQHPRAAEHDRAAGHHDAGRRHRRRRSAVAGAR